MGVFTVSKLRFNTFVVSWDKNLEDAISVQVKLLDANSNEKKTESSLIGTSTDDNVVFEELEAGEWYHLVCAMLRVDGTHLLEETITERAGECML